MRKIGIILVVWNNWKDTFDCLRSLVKLELKDGYEVEIVVVDNGSEDHGMRKLKKEFPFIHGIEHPSNVGFSGGNNIGIKYLLSRGAEFIWLLNNDTVVSPLSCMALVTELEKNKGIAGSKIYFAPGSEYHRNRYEPKDQGNILWYAGGVIDWLNMYAFHRGVDEVDGGKYEKSEETMFVTGCSLMFSSRIIDIIGLFDESFFLYYEDVEFCLRASSAGFSVRFVPFSKIWHKNSGSSDGPGGKVQEYYQTRNRFRVGMKYCTLRTRFALLRECMRNLCMGSLMKKRAASDFLLGRYGRQI